MTIRQILFTLSLITIPLFAQGEKPDPSKFYSLFKLTDAYYKSGMADSMPRLSQELIKESIALKNDSFQVVSYRLYGNYYYLKCNYTLAIKEYQKGILIAEKTKKLNYLLPQLYNNIGFNYNMLNLRKQTIENLRAGELSAIENNNHRSLAYIYENMAVYHINSNMLDSQIKPDSSIYFLKKAEKSNYQFSRDPNFNPKDSNYIRAAIYIDYAKSYSQIYYRDLSPKYLNMAKNYFTTAINFSKKTEDNKHLSSALYEYANLFFKISSYDSCQKYAFQSYKIATKFDYVDLIIKSADLLQKLFKEQGKLRNAYKYLEIKDNYTQKLSTLNQSSQISEMAFNESTKAMEVEKAKMEQKKDRDLLLIAVGIISFLIIILVLSGTFIVNEKFIKFFGQIGLLVFFEFVNLNIHSIIEGATHHNSYMILFILVTVALIIIPIHHKLENYVKIQLVERNKRIRKSNAIEVLEESENKSETTHHLED